LLGNSESPEKNMVTPALAHGRRDEAAAPPGADTGGVAMDVDDAFFGFHRNRSFLSLIQGTCRNQRLAHLVDLTGFSRCRVFLPRSDEKID